MLPFSLEYRNLKIYHQLTFMEYLWLIHHMIWWSLIETFLLFLEFFMIRQSILKIYQGHYLFPSPIIRNELNVESSTLEDNLRDLWNT